MRTWFRTASGLAASGYSARMMAILVRRRVLVPVIAALAVVGLTVLGERDPGRWLVIGRALDHWTYAGVIVGVLLIIAVTGIRTQTWWSRGPKIVVALVLALITFEWVVVTSSFPQDLRVQHQIAAPGGHGYRLIVAEGSDLIDEIWTLDIRTGSGITMRQWRFGCLTEDAGDGLVSAAWDGPARVVVTINSDEPRRVVVPIDAATGRPKGTVNTWNGCDD